MDVFMLQVYQLPTGTDAQVNTLLAGAAMFTAMPKSCSSGKVIIWKKDGLGKILPSRPFLDKRSQLVEKIPSQWRFLGIR